MKSKLWGLGVSLIVTALLVVIAVNLFSPSAMPGARPAGGLTTSDSPNPGAGYTARAAYQAAQTWAQNWAADAELVAISTTVERSKALNGWTLQLYSPSQRRIAIILVTGENVQLLQEQLAPYTQSPITQAAWVQDSDVIFKHWWQERGRTLWSRPESQTLLLHLGQGETALTWRIVVLDQQGELLEHWEVTATTGEPLATP